MKISCIIPTRNRCKLVLEAIESVRQQKLNGIEIVLVDDGSEDNTCSIVASQFPEVKQVQLTGKGPGAARNAGVSAASGDILMFLDSDDTWLANHARKLIEVLERGYRVAYGVTLTRDEVAGRDFLIPENGLGPEGDCFSALLRWCNMVPSSLALHHDIFWQIGGFDELAFGEDWSFLLKLGARYHFGFAGPTPITLRRLHRGSLCFLRNRKNLLAIINQVLTVLEDEPRATVAHLDHFRMLHDWTAAKMDRLTTVQDWFKAMREENLI